MKTLLSIDQGTTSSRAILFDLEGQALAQHQQEFEQFYPADAWVEHDAEEIWQVTLSCVREALASVPQAVHNVAAIGISNQRETTVVWDKQTGEPIGRAIVWQDRRTADVCEQLKQDPDLERKLQMKTGLLIDPYFSATKIAWLLDHVAGARQRAERGELAFGTIDSFLLWRLTGGRVHATDATNASRTLLYNIVDGAWDPELLALFRVPAAMMPEVKDSAGHFGETDPQLLGAAIPITGIAGDQQAATVGQVCFESGMVKSTYGTGCFMVLNTGRTPVVSQHRLLSTIAYQINGVPTYALEGSIFIAGAALTWLRDALQFFQQSSETQSQALSVPDNGGVYLVPAFTGLGAPYWDPHARGALLGLTRDTQIEHIVRAALEAVCYQSRDLLQAMMADSGLSLSSVRVDGGMVANDWLLQFLADTLDIAVDRPQCIESSALGAALLAGLGAGLYEDQDALTAVWQRRSSFTPAMAAADRERFYEGWQQAVNCITAQG